MDGMEYASIFYQKINRFIRGRDKFINAGAVGLNSSNKADLNFNYYKDHSDNSTFDPKRVKQLRDTFGREPSYTIPVQRLVS